MRKLNTRPGSLSCWLMNAMGSRYLPDTSAVASREKLLTARTGASTIHKANSLRVYSESMLSWPFFLKKNGTRGKSPLRTIREFALRHQPGFTCKRPLAAARIAHRADLAACYLSRDRSYVLTVQRGLASLHPK